MSLSINHPSGKVTSTTSLSFEVQGGTPTSPKNINLSASSVIMPNVQQPIGQTGALIFDTNNKRMKYYDGIQWIPWVPSSEITAPLEQSIADIRSKLNTKVDSVIFNSSAVPAASISDTTLYITFPTSNNSGGGANGLFTSLPPGAISHYSLLSGQTPASIREQMGGMTNSQAGRDGTQAKPFITNTGWCYADGNYWLWKGASGDVIQRVPNLNQNAYLKAMSTSGITKTDSVISSYGVINGTQLSVDNLPPHSFSVSGTTNIAGSHVHAQTLRGNDRTGTNAITASNDAGVPLSIQNMNPAGDHSHTVNGSTNTLGSGVPHTHILNDVDVSHFNVAVLYNIAQPSLALNQNAGDARYVLKTGDVMSGTLTIASTAVVRGNDDNVTFWFRNANNGERAIIYHNNGSNTLRFRTNGGNEVSIDNTGTVNSNGIYTNNITTTNLIRSSNIITSGITTNSLTVSGYASAANLGVTGQLSVAGQASTGNLYVNGQVTASGDIWAFSDINLKENIRPITNASNILSKISSIFGNMKDDPDKVEKSMVIAQEVQEVFPQAVTKDANGYLKVNYIALIPLLIAAFNERMK